MIENFFCSSTDLNYDKISSILQKELLLQNSYDFPFLGPDFATETKTLTVNLYKRYSSVLLKEFFSTNDPFTELFNNYSLCNTTHKVFVKDVFGFSMLYIVIYFDLDYYQNQFFI